MCSSSRAVATRLIAIDKSSRALEPALCFARVIATMHAEMARGMYHIDIMIVTSSSMINVNFRRARPRASGSIHLPWCARIPSRPVIAFAPRTYQRCIIAIDIMCTCTCAPVPAWASF